MKLAGKWMELEETYPCDVTQIQKVQHGKYSLTRDISCRVKDNQGTLHRLREAS